jgi:hypothetical protein
MLLEPTDDLDHLPYEHMNATSRSSRYLDESLRKVSCGLHNINNMIVLDMRMFGAE